MKAVLMSIQPKWCELIASGKKTVELRKKRPELETPFKCYIYCTNREPLMKTADNSFFVDNSYIEGENLYGLYELVNGKVIGEFVCNEIFPIRVFENGSIQDYNRHSMERSCVPYDDIANYIGNGCMGYVWHITDLVIYDKPKELREFKRSCPDNVYSCAMCRHGDYTGMKCTPITRPPQSWCYVEKGGE